MNPVSSWLLSRSFTKKTIEGQGAIKGEKGDKGDPGEQGPQGEVPGRHPRDEGDPEGGRDRCSEGTHNERQAHRRRSLRRKAMSRGRRPY